MDMHILETAGNSARVAFHTPIADDVTGGGLSVRTVLIGRSGVVTSVVPNIEAGELAQLEAGEIKETIKVIRFPGEARTEAINLDINGIETGRTVTVTREALEEDQKPEFIKSTYITLADQLDQQRIEEFKDYGKVLTAP